MTDICPQCGLPQDLCVCETIAREQQQITVTMEKKKFGKKYTIINGIGKEANINEIFKKLKSKFACGGTAKDGKIELQGDHRPKIKESLAQLGFPAESITIEKK